MLITDQYPSVVATQWRLQTKVMEDGKQIWNVNCKSKVMEGKRLQVSSYVEHINSVDNNTHFEIHDDETVEAHESNRSRAKVRTEDGSNMTNSDVLKSIAKGMEAIAGNETKKGKKSKKVEVSADVVDEYIELAGKKPFHGWDEETIKGKIEELKQ